MTQKNHAYAVIGLGSMGYGMAASLLRAGHKVHGFDINPDAVARFQNEGGTDGALKDIAGSLDGVVVVVLNAEQTEDILFGAEGVAAMLEPGAVVMGCVTVPPEFAARMAAQCNAKGLHYLDAPISGGAARAATGELTIMASGTAEAFAAARPILDATAVKVFELGDEAGAGSAMKSVNQLLAGVHIAAMAEAMAFGMTRGISPDTFLAIIPECAGTSWMLENRGPHIAAGDYTPLSRLAIQPKDLNIVLDLAKDTGFDAPIARAALTQYNKALAMGLGDEDDAAVVKVYAHAAGLDLPKSGDGAEK